MSLPLLAGYCSTLLFAAGVLPMVLRAWRTRDLASYSRSQLGLANVGNVVYAVYVFSLPAGPLWALHAFYLVSTALMLWWHVRHVPAGSGRSVSVPGPLDPGGQTPDVRGDGAGRPVLAHVLDGADDLGCDQRDQRQGGERRD